MIFKKKTTMARQIHEQIRKTRLIAEQTVRLANKNGIVWPPEPQKCSNCTKSPLMVRFENEETLATHCWFKCPNCKMITIKSIPIE